MQVKYNGLKEERWLWQVSVVSFILAALTGLVYRLGLIGWLPEWGLSLGNIRHAHSHLMFFGWAVPLPLYIMRSQIMSVSGRQERGTPWMKYALFGTLFFGMASYPFFLIFGYRPVAIGTLSLPLSVILSGMVMICWYIFMGGYLKRRSLLDGEPCQSWFDSAQILLLISSLGAWSVAVVQALAPNNHLLMKGMTHFFLAAFTEGWIVLALLAILVAKFSIGQKNWPISHHVSLGCIAIGAPLTFPYGISESLLSPTLLWTARLGGLLAAFGLFQALYVIISSSPWKKSPWVWPVALLALKALMQMGASFIPSSFLFSDHALRIFYLHVLLLGAFTLTMTGWLSVKASIPGRYFSGIAVTVLLMLLSLLPLTSFWPVRWSGPWVFYAAAATALLPALAVTAQWIKIIQIEKNPNPHYDA
ncbi:hypothetical protein [Fodinibius sediminis]|uniref:NnrS protein n=1 Tax=Fodinibius sediminis TaxID=1214077 RepID=A0A521BMC3_9BACT|nr:hypothetical protein [Fodinibius sediminis]SMO47921.1 hypothetical protein SAMN06265218_103216 [Fodinibius sediminis]